MKYIMGIIGIAEANYTDLGIPERRYLVSFDPEAHKGRGRVTTTADSDLAKVFDSVEELHQLWNTQSKTVPFRLPDGGKNKPLTAFTIEIVKKS